MLRDNYVLSTLLFLSLLCFVGKPLFYKLFVSRTSLYYSPLVHQRENLWEEESAIFLPSDLTLRRLEGYNFQTKNNGAKKKVCIGVTLYRRKTPYFYTLLFSLASSSKNIPHVTIFWHPFDAEDAANSTTVLSLRRLGLNIVRVDHFATLVTPPISFGFALEYFAKNENTCEMIFIIEDDAVAAVNWLSTTTKAISHLDAIDPKWVMLKLHRSDFSNFYDLSSLIFLLCIFFPLFLTASFILRHQNRNFKFHVVRTTIFSGLAILVLWILGRPLAPCFMNSLACNGILALEGDWDMTVTQAQAFNPRMASTFSSCMINTPVATSGVCWQVDLAMHRCLSKAGKSYTNCTIFETGLSGLWGLHPSVFQHTGIKNGNGHKTPLRISERWDEDGSTKTHFYSLYK